MLAKFKGRTVVLCTKEFMPEKFPVVFANAAGKVSCSRAFVSDELPLLMLVPDSVPQSLEALEIADDSEVRMGAELLAVAPTAADTALWEFRCFRRTKNTSTSPPTRTRAFRIKST